MIIPRHLYDELIDHARSEAPRECCGLIGCRDGEATRIYRCGNVAPNPEWGYAIDGGMEFFAVMDMRRRSLELGGIYHSHIHAPPSPSESDVRLAKHPAVTYLIIGPGLEPEVLGWRIAGGLVTEERLVISGWDSHARWPSSP